MIARSHNLKEADGDRWANLITQIRTLLGFTIPTDSLAMFFEGISFYLRSGRSVADTVLREATSGVDPELRRICAAIAPRLSGGASLCSCLRPYERRFPPIVLSILEVGEVSGGLADAAQRLSDTFQQTTSFARKFRQNVYNPTYILIILCIFKFAFMVAHKSMKLQPDRPIAATALYITAGVASTAIQLVLTYLIGRCVLLNLYRWQSVRYFVDTVKLALPRLGIVTRNLSAARWARSFAVLWAAGVNISTALEVSSRSALNAPYERALRQAALHTRQGMPLSQSLARTQLLPTHLLSVIVTCEEAGQLDNGLLILATDMERDALARAMEEMNKVIVVVEIIVIFLLLVG